MTFEANRRIRATLEPHQVEQLNKLAALHGIAVSRVVARVLGEYLRTGRADLPDDASAATVEASRPAAAVRTSSSPDGDPPAWLPPHDPEALEAWIDERGDSVLRLRRRYPLELDALDDEGWTGDALVREALWSLCLWRDLLDAGVYDDPRVEIAFRHAMLDLRMFLEDRREQQRALRQKAIPDRTRDT